MEFGGREAALEGRGWPGDRRHSALGIRQPAGEERESAFEARGSSVYRRQAASGNRQSAVERHSALGIRHSAGERRACRAAIPSWLNRLLATFLGSRIPDPGSRLLPLLLLLLLTTSCVQTPPRRMNVLRTNDVDHGFYRGTWPELEDLMRHQALAGEIPAAAVAIDREGTPIYRAAWGRTMPDARGEPVTPYSYFDVASLTKTLAGIPAAAAMLELPEMSTRERAILPLLLRHSVGLDDQRHFPALHGIERCFDAGAATGTYRYANANYLFLTFRAEARLGDPAALLRAEAWQPAGADPLWDPPADRAVWSGRGMRGVVLAGTPYDPVAAAMKADGRAFVLHSGLFASADGTARFGSALLADPPATPLLEATAALALSPPVQVPLADDPERSLWLSEGGMTSALGPPYAFEAAPPGRFYYQTGYTGCLLWIDRRTRTSVAFLTNAAAAGERDEFHAVSERLIQILLAGTRRDYAVRK